MVPSHTDQLYILILGCLSSLCSLHCRRCINPNKEGHHCLHSSFYGEKMCFHPLVLDLPPLWGPWKRTSYVSSLTFRDGQIKSQRPQPWGRPCHQSPVHWVCGGCVLHPLGLPALAVGVAGPVTPSPHKGLWGSCCCLLFSSWPA